MAAEDDKYADKPYRVKYECETSDTDKVIVRMPNARTKEIMVPVPPNARAGTPREDRLGVADETVGDVKHQLLREDDYQEETFGDYEMLIVGLQGEQEVMDDTSHISTYRTKLCSGREIFLEIRLRTNQNREANPSHPELFGCTLK